MKRKGVQIGIVFLLCVALNVIAYHYFFRLDLTEEKRYSLSPLTIETLRSLKKTVSVQILLEGDFPPAIKRFQTAIKGLCEQMKAYGGFNFQYQFVDPTGNKELIQFLYKNQVQGIPVNITTEEMEQVRKWMYPIAIFRYEDQEVIVDLIRGSAGPDGQINLLKAEQDLEYKLMSPIYRFVNTEKRIIAFLQGHGEPHPNQLPREIIEELKTRYQVIPVYTRYGYALPNAPHFYPDSIRERLPKGKDGISVLVVLNPDSAFTEREKYEIDQFIMRGGRVLWILDQEKVNLQNGPTLTELRELNLDDLFFKYGLKVNYDLVQDYRCGAIDLVIGFHNGPVWRSEKWIYFPMIYRFLDHPVTKNLDAVLLRYASTLDTLPRPGIHHLPFMTTSPLSRTLSGSVYVELVKDITDPPPPEVMKGKGNRIVGTEITGYFSSLFEHRKAPTDAFAPQPPSTPFFKRCVIPTKQIVISDGDLLRPMLVRGKPAYIPLDNKTLFMNCLDYLAGDESLTQIRAKEIKVRLMNRELVRTYRWWIVAFNLITPLLLLVGVGIIYYWIRKKAFQKPWT